LGTVPVVASTTLPENMLVTVPEKNEGTQVNKVVGEFIVTPPRATASTVPSSATKANVTGAGLAEDAKINFIWP